MDSERGTPAKDIWDKIAASSGIVAAILVPIAVAFVGAQYSAALKQRELEVSARREYVQIGLSILRDPGTKSDLRKWGTDIVNHYADVKMPEPTKDALNEGRQNIPYGAEQSTAASAGRLTRIDELQTEGIKALLARNFEAATKAYDTAYQLWPTFRNVYEILNVLKSHPQPPQSDQEWKDVYRRIAPFDLRGVDPKILAQLRQEAR